MPEGARGVAQAHGELGFAVGKPHSAAIAVIEGSGHGHRFMYVGRLVREALDQELCVELVTTSSALATCEYREHVSNLAKATGFTLRTAHSLKPSRRALQVALAPVSRRVLIPDGDAWLPFAAFAPWRREEVTLLLMRTLPSKGRGSAFLVKAILANVVNALPGRRVLRLTVPGRASARDCHLLLRHLEAVPDPTPVEMNHDVQAVRRTIGARPGRQLALVAGLIDERKSIAHLIDWLTASALDDPPAVLLSGRQSSAVQGLMRTTAVEQLVTDGRLVIEDRFLTDRELAARYAASDVVLVLHENEGPSGAVAHAMTYGKPIIAWGAQQVVGTVRAEGWGVVLPDRTPADLDRAVEAVRAWCAPGRSTSDVRSDFLAHFLP